ncbi:CPBP family intramembrane glutamic endopeptidase [Pelagicoccus albus]|uniref:CPBP family intramembrane metalloprotease n=1 Tax=Pelagicoccus albus TaxID=415222 RepID=A0A7X1B6Z4_9BACT|nr:type II CAAX endopeptidase family protein [Pelagicoccus albus]MBC2606796.1 CPBP family intramembrane metalloprotease [Pelagicoccus albus]
MPHSHETLELKPVWSQLSPSPLVFVIIAFGAFTALRAYGFFGPELYDATPVLASFLLMFFLPFASLTREGKEQIGIGAPVSLKWLLIAILAGSLLATALYELGLILYQKGDKNWLSSLAFILQSDDRMPNLSRQAAFFVFSVPAILAAPLGQELFYRGMLEKAARSKWSPVGAACVSAAFFGAAQLLSHGVQRGYHGLQILVAPGAIWFGLMFATGLVFSYLRHKGRSIWTPVVAHAAFNLTLNYYLFYYYLVSEPKTVLPA